MISENFAQCDRCKETFPDSTFITPIECEDWMKESGWKKTKEGDICEGCAINTMICEKAETCAIPDWACPCKIPHKCEPLHCNGIKCGSRVHKGVKCIPIKEG